VYEQTKEARGYRWGINRYRFEKRRCNEKKSGEIKKGGVERALGEKGRMERRERK